jgi:uncharacterized protein
MSLEYVGPLELPDTHVYTLNSEVIDARFRITVAMPPGAVDGEIATVYLLDPIATLETTIGVTRARTTLAMGSFPPLLVVGVGYDADPASIMSLRMRDQTPTEAVPPPALSSPIPASHGTGGADSFLTALATEVMPLVEQRHQASAHDRTLVGWSLGGLLGLHALLDRPELFHRHLLVSPAVWWDDFVIIRREAISANNGALIEKPVYLAVGDREESAVTRSWPPGLTADAIETGRMVTTITHLAGRLRRREAGGAGVELDVLPDEHHVTIYPTAVSRGLQYLFTSAPNN